MFCCNCELPGVVTDSCNPQISSNGASNKQLLAWHTKGRNCRVLEATTELVRAPLTNGALVFACDFACELAMTVKASATIAASCKAGSSIAAKLCPFSLTRVAVVACSDASSLPLAYTHLTETAVAEVTRMHAYSVHFALTRLAISPFAKMA